MDGPIVEIDANANPLPQPADQRRAQERAEAAQAKARAKARASAQRLAAEQARSMRMDVADQVERGREQARKTMDWQRRNAQRMREVASEQLTARAGLSVGEAVPRIEGAPLAQAWMAKYTLPERQAQARTIYDGAKRGGGGDAMESGAEKAGRALSEFASRVAIGGAAISVLRETIGTINASIDRRMKTGEDHGALNLRAATAARTAGASDNTVESVLTVKQKATREMQVRALERIAEVSKQRVERGLPAVGDKLTRRVLSDVTTAGDMAPVEALESPMGAMGQNYEGAVQFRLGGVIGDRSLPADEAVRRYGDRMAGPGKRELAVRSQVDLASEVTARSVGDTGDMLRIADSQARMGTEVGIAERLKEKNYAGAAIMEYGAQTEAYRMSSRVGAMGDANQILANINATLERQTAIMERGTRMRPEAGTESAP